MVKKPLLLFILLFMVTQISHEEIHRARRRPLKISFTIYPRDYHEKRIQQIINDWNE